MVSAESVVLGAEAVRRLALAGRYEIGPRLTDAEIARVEDEHGFEFADDHRALLQAGLPFNGPPAQDTPGRRRGQTGAAATTRGCHVSRTGPSKGSCSTPGPTASGTAGGVLTRPAPAWPSGSPKSTWPRSLG
jgi:hypothetical protein